MSHSFKEGGASCLEPVIKDYDGNPLKGPHSMVLSEKNNTMFFTDSGPLGETSIENPTGSIFAIDLGVSMLKPVVYNKLANPTGIAISNEENIIFVSETGLNRILRIALHPSGVYHSTVFH
jgi:sugar lactone lactonase YvrE